MPPLAHLRRALCALLLPLCAACPGPRSGEGAHLLLITVDTLRADHLGAYGDELVDTPALDAFAARALVFEQAWTPIPITTPALGSLLTSSLPQNHGALNNSYDLATSDLTLADVLQGSGYATAAFLPTWLANKPGFRSGFDHYDAPSVGQEHRDGPDVVARALAWLEASERADARPWFVWVHLLEPHSPYEPGPELEAKYLPADAPAIGDGLRSEVFGESIERTPAEVELIRALYRGEVEATDRALAPLLSWVESHRSGGAREQHGEILSVFTADHGELLYEHERYVGHTAWLWEEMLRVPLWLHFTSGREQAQRSAFPASLLDVAPTVLPVLGVPFESVDGGRDLLQNDMGGERMLVHSTFSPEGHYDQYALRLGADKLHLASDRPGSLDRMYDIDADLMEQLDVVGERPPRSAELRALWERWRAQQDDPRSHRDPLVDAELRRQLEALGYSQGSVLPERVEDE